MGRILINNIDIKDYGVTVLNDYIKELLNPPDKEEVTAIEWYEGQIDVDLSDGIQFKREREVKFECYQDGIFGNFNSFLDVLSVNPYNLFTFEEIALNLHLKLLKIENNNILSPYKKQTFTLTFLQDDFIESFTDSHIPQNHPGDNTCFIEDINVCDFGFVLLENSLNKLTGRTFVDSLAGANHSLGGKFIDGELSFGCCTLNISLFKTNFNSFIGLLTTPNLKRLKIQYQDETIDYKFFYDSINITSLYLETKKVFAIFTLKIKSIQ